MLTELNAIDTWQEVPKDLLGDNGKLYPANWRIEVQCPRLNSVRKWNAINPDDQIASSKHIMDIVETNTRIIDTTTEKQVSSKYIYEHDKFPLLFLIYDKFNTENKREHNIFTEAVCQNPKCREHYPKLIVSAANFRFKCPDSKYDQFIDTTSGTYIMKTSNHGEVHFKPSTLGLGERGASWVQTLDANYIKDNMDVIETVLSLCTDHSIVDDKYLRKMQTAEYNLWSDDKKIFYLNLINNLNTKIEGALGYTCAKCNHDFRASIPYRAIDKTMFVNVQSFDAELFGQSSLDNKEHVGDTE
jgi:hypothetical protein